MPPKRKSRHDTQDIPANEPNETSDGSAEDVIRSATRNRRPTVKQALILEDKRAAMNKEYQELQQKLKVLKKNAKKLQEEPDPEDDANADANANASAAFSELDFESEEEDANIVKEREHRSKFLSRGLFDAPLSAGQRQLRREGETRKAASGSHTTPTDAAGDGHATGASTLAVTQSVSSSASPRTARLAILPAPLLSLAHLTTPHSPGPAMEDLDDIPSSPSHPLAAGLQSFASSRASSSSRSHASMSSVHEDARGRSSQARSRSPIHHRTPSRSPARYRDYYEERYSRSRSHDKRKRPRPRSPRYYRSRSPSSRHHPSHRSARGTVTTQSTSSSPSSTTNVLAAALVAPSDSTTLPAPFKNGTAPSGKPKARDYEPRVAKLINHACHQYEVLLATDQPFPDPGVIVVWAARVWADVCKALQMNYALSDRIEKIITARGSHARGVLRDKLRPLIAQTYGFLADGSERSKVKNIARYTFLLDRDALAREPRFHYRDVEAKDGFAQNSIITTSIKAQWFADSAAPGIKYSAQFSPLREVTLAFIFTTIEFCLDQYATGHYDQNLTYSDKVYRPKYAVHLKQIRDWCKIDHDATCMIRQRMYDRARRSSGAPPEARAVSGLSEASRDRLRLEILAQANAWNSGDEE